MLSESESEEVQRLLRLTTDPASPPLAAYARGRLRAWLARADGDDLEAVEARLAGWTYQQIADELGYRSHSGARKAVETTAPPTSTAPPQHPANECPAGDQ